MTATGFSVLIVSTILVVGCATPPNSSVGPDAHYYQVRHPLSGGVAFQMSMPTAQACRWMMARTRADKDMKEMAEFFSCASTSASLALPTRAIIKNKVHGFMLELEAISLSECKAFVNGMLKAENRETLELVADCKQK